MKKFMKKILIIPLLIIMILLPLFPEANSLYSIPPTNAYAHIKTLNGTNNANNYSATVKFQGLNGISIYKGSSNTIYFNSTSGNSSSAKIVNYLGAYVTTNSPTRWYGSWANQGTPTTNQSNGGAMIVEPMIISKQITTDKIETEITTAQNSTNCRLGIYTDNGTAYPKTLVTGSDVGQLATNTTGVKTNTFSSPITLTAGLYWLASSCTDHAGSFDTISKDTSAVTTQGSGSSLSNTMTIGSNSNRMLIAGVSLTYVSGAPTVSTVKIGSTDFTHLSNADGRSSIVTFGEHTEIWYLINPPTGSQTVTATYSASVADSGLGLLSVYNADQVTGMQSGANNNGLTGSASVSITPTVTNSWIFGHMSSTSGGCTPSDTSDWSNGANAVLCGNHKTNPTISSANSLTYGTQGATWATSGGEILAHTGMTMSPTFRAIPASSIPPTLGMISTMGSSNGGTGYKVPFGFGSLPSSFPSTGSIIATPEPEILIHITSQAS